MNSCEDELLSLSYGFNFAFLFNVNCIDLSFNKVEMDFVGICLLIQLLQ